MGFQRRSERLNGVLLLDALGEDIPEGGSDISEGSVTGRTALSWNLWAREHQGEI